MKILTSQELKEKIESGETFMVDLFAEWCGPCRVMGPIIDRVSQKLEQDNSPVGVYKFDIETDKQTAMDLGVRSIPTIKVFKNGKEEKTMVGVVSEQQLIAVAQELL
jgi:thioredoxin 1